MATAWQASNPRLNKDDDDDSWDRPSHQTIIESDLIADSWDDDNVEFDLQSGAAIDARARAQREAEAQTQQKNVTIKPKSEWEEKMQSREEKDRVRWEQERAFQVELESMSILERKKVLQQKSEEADLQSAKELFRGGALSRPEKAIEGYSLDTAMPRTKAEWDKLAAALVERWTVLRKGAKTPRTFMLFVKELFRQLLVEGNALSLAEVAELGSYVSASLVPEREKRESASGSGRGGTSSTGSGSGASVSRASRAPKRGTLKLERGDDFGDWVNTGRGGTAASASATAVPDDDDDIEFM